MDVETGFNKQIGGEKKMSKTYRLPINRKNIELDQKTLN